MGTTNTKIRLNMKKCQSGLSMRIVMVTALSSFGTTTNFSIVSIPPYILSTL